MKTNVTQDESIRIAKQAMLYSCTMSHGQSVKCACSDAGEDTPEMRSVVSAVLTNYEINGRWTN